MIYALKRSADGNENGAIAGGVVVGVVDVQETSEMDA